MVEGELWHYGEVALLHFGFKGLNREIIYSLVSVRLGFLSF